MNLLIVDDEKDVANFLKRSFKSHGFKTSSANDGMDALKKIKNEKFDLVILDLLLPKINGDKVLKEIRESENNIPIIILSVLNDTNTKIKLLNMGADDFVEKPFTFMELFARTESVLRRAKGVSDNQKVMKVGNLKLDPGTHLVTRNGKIIKLRRKEYSLLEYLMRNPNKIISRNTLLETVWNYNAKIYSNSVDSHVSLLRTKINAGCKEKIIDTIHGIGYILRTK